MICTILKQKIKKIIKIIIITKNLCIFAPVHRAEHAFKGCEGVGQSYWNSVLQRFVFGHLKLRTSTISRKHCRVDASGGLLLSRSVP